jgi:hypothetical protein
MVMMLQLAAQRHKVRRGKYLLLYSLDENCYAMTFGGDNSGIYAVSLFPSPSE